MARYKLSNALRYCDPKEFKSDKAAWNSLRKHFLFKEEDGSVSGCYIWLWKEIEVEVSINNEEEYVKMHNAKYGPRPYGYGLDNAKLLKIGEPNIHTVWIPILEGITTHPYNVTKKKEITMALYREQLEPHMYSAKQRRHKSYKWAKKHMKGVNGAFGMMNNILASSSRKQID